jgi:Flp pilus assembly protein TadG
MLVFNQYYRNRKGQSMVEFALVLPLLLLLLGGIVDFGHAFYQYSSIENAARDVARGVSINKSTGFADEQIIENALAILPVNWAATATVAGTTVAGSRASGTPVTATVTCKPQTFFGCFYQAFIPDPLTVRVTAVQE